MLCVVLICYIYLLSARP